MRHLRLCPECEFLLKIKIPELQTEFFIESLRIVWIFLDIKRNMKENISGEDQRPWICWSLDSTCSIYVVP